MLRACIWEYLSNHVRECVKKPCPARNEHVGFIKKNKNEMSTQRGVRSCFLLVCSTHVRVSWLDKANTPSKNKSKRN